MSDLDNLVPCGDSMAAMCAQLGITCQSAVDNGLSRCHAPRWAVRVCAALQIRFGLAENKASERDWLRRLAHVRSEEQKAELCALLRLGAIEALRVRVIEIAWEGERHGHAVP